MKPDHQKHDRFIKAVFSDVEKAREYFEENLPADLLELLDLTSLKHTKKSFITNELQEYFADVVFEVKLKSGKSSAYASILLEHKSKIYKFVTVQQGHYIFSALMEQIKAGVKQLMPIIPVLFYHGKTKWDYHTHRSLYEGLDASVLRYIPEYDYVYHNLQAMSDYEILQQKAAFWNTVSLILKHAHDEDYLISQAGVIFSRFEDGTGNHLEPVLVYFISRIKSKANMIKAIDFMPEPVKGKARNAYDELILEGMEKGIEKGQLENTRLGTVNFFKNGVPIETIAKSFEISEDAVRNILREAGLIPETK